MGHGIDNVAFESLNHGDKKRSINATINLYLPQAIGNLLGSSPDAVADREWVVGRLRDLVNRVEQNSV